MKRRQTTRRQFQREIRSNIVGCVTWITAQAVIVPLYGRGCVDACGLKLVAEAQIL